MDDQLYFIDIYFFELKTWVGHGEDTHHFDFLLLNDHTNY